MLDDEARKSASLQARTRRAREQRRLKSATRPAPARRDACGSPERGGERLPVPATTEHDTPGPTGAQKSALMRRRERARGSGMGGNGLTSDITGASGFIAGVRVDGWVGRHFPISTNLVEINVFNCH